MCRCDAKDQAIHLFAMPQVPGWRRCACCHAAVCKPLASCAAAAVPHHRGSSSMHPCPARPRCRPGTPGRQPPRARRASPARLRQRRRRSGAPLPGSCDAPLPPPAASHVATSTAAAAGVLRACCHPYGCIHHANTNTMLTENERVCNPPRRRCAVRRHARDGD